MSEEKYDEWIAKSYFYMIADYVIAVSLSETDFACHIADKWINSSDDLKKSAGYSTYSWMLSRRKDSDFDVNSIRRMLDFIISNINESTNRTRYSMYYFVYNVGLSYMPLHSEALEIAKQIGDIEYSNHQGKSKIYNAENDITKQVDKGRLGFKRKYVRC